MKILLALVATLSLVSCATSIAPPAPRGTIDHVVLMWLKRPGNSADRQAIIAACDELRSIPGVRLLDAGTPLASDRPVVDDSFDIALVVRFVSPEALAAYLVDPLHVRKLNEILKPQTRKILVYDIAY